MSINSDEVRVQRHTIDDTFWYHSDLHEFVKICSLVPSTIHHERQQLIFCHGWRRPSSELVYDESLEHDTTASTPRGAHVIFPRLQVVDKLAN